MAAKITTPRCTSCQSENQKTFTAEVAIHFPGLKGLDKPIVWVFPQLLVCLECGRSEFVIKERELKVIQTGLPIQGAMILWPKT